MFRAAAIPENKLDGYDSSGTPPISCSCVSRMLATDFHVVDVHEVILSTSRPTSCLGHDAVSILVPMFRG